MRRREPLTGRRNLPRFAPAALALLLALLALGIWWMGTGAAVAKPPSAHAASQGTQALARAQGFVAAHVDLQEINQTMPPKGGPGLWEAAKAWPCVLVLKKSNPGKTVYKFHCSVVLLDREFYLTPDRQTAYFQVQGYCPTPTQWGCRLRVPAGWWPPEVPTEPAVDGLLNPWWAGFLGFTIKVTYEQGARKPKLDPGIGEYGPDAHRGGFTWPFWGEQQGVGAYEAY
jgi:hypothetical protein